MEKKEDKETKDLIKKLSKEKKTPVISTKDMLSTGSTLLNLACSDKPFGGFAIGHYYFLVGDSTSGKTWFTLTCLAEATRRKRFASHRFIYDNSENGALMDMEKFYGENMASRLEPPGGTKQDPVYSTTVEQFYDHLDDAFKQGDPFIYILDSENSLDSTQAEEKYQEQKAARRKGRAAAGSYGDGKAKIHSSTLRKCIGKLKKHDSILIIISQTRDNINAGPFESKKTRSGGRSLKFYATVEIWTSVFQKIKKTVLGKPRVVGTLCELKVEKNRFTGGSHTTKVKVPIYHSYGIDDIGSCIDYLVDEGYWKNRSGMIVSKEYDTMKREKLITYIEENELETELQIIVGKLWNEIRKACSLKRKPKYG